jgi:hypothetical protein
METAVSVCVSVRSSLSQTGLIDTNQRRLATFLSQVPWRDECLFIDRVLTGLNVSKFAKSW